MSDPNADFETVPVGTLAKLERYEAITKLASESELADIHACINGNDASEVGKLKASLVYTAAALGREIAMCADTSAKLERMREALELADDHLTTLYPKGVEGGDYLCCAIRAATALERLSVGDGEREELADACRQAAMDLVARYGASVISDRVQKSAAVLRAPTAPVVAFKVSVGEMQESHQKTWWVQLVRSDCPKNKIFASPAEGYITPYKTTVREQAYHEAAEWAAFLGVPFDAALTPGSRDNG